MSNLLPKIDVIPKNGSEPFTQHGIPLSVTLLDFWRWSASDLLNNAMRGVLAEYIVACALGIARGVRTEWDAYDLLTANGTRIEVKSAAYLQSWHQKSFSHIQFGIRPTHFWNETTGKYDFDLRRQGDVYVFCVLHHQDKTTVNPLNLDQWEFYVLPASVLNEKFPAQKSIRLSALLALNPVKVAFNGLAAAIHALTAATQSISTSQP